MISTLACLGCVFMAFLIGLLLGAANGEDRVNAYKEGFKDGQKTGD